MIKASFYTIFKLYLKKITPHHIQIVQYSHLMPYRKAKSGFEFSNSVLLEGTVISKMPIMLDRYQREAIQSSILQFRVSCIFRGVPREVSESR
jgi:hypothetical protein